MQDLSEIKTLDGSKVSEIQITANSEYYHPLEGTKTYLYTNDEIRT